MSEKMLPPTDDGLPLEAIDRHLADFLSGLPGNASTEFWCASALASQATHLGHICTDLAAVCRDFAGRSLCGRDGPVECPRLEDWLAKLRSSAAVGEPGMVKPLILDESGGSARIYLFRYWRYEQIVADFLQRKAVQRDEDLDWDILRRGLDRLFPRAAASEPDWQRVAAATALCRKFAVITGGPGSGKTSTVVRILSLLLEQARGRRLRLALAAPTAKAAARIVEAIGMERQTIRCDAEILEQLPLEASTLHRLLGLQPDSSRPRYNSENRLPLDILIVDEGSMVDLPMMAKTVQALPDTARFLLLGDRDQLASVEPGRVFGDICGEVRKTTFSADFSAEIQSLSGMSVPVLPDGQSAAGLQDSIVVLERNYRFNADSRIAALSRAVNSGDSRGAMDAMLAGGGDEVIWRDLPSAAKLEETLVQRLLIGYQDLFQAATLDGCFDALTRFRVLCAVTQGEAGLDAINAMAGRLHHRIGRVPPGVRWHRGQPVLVTTNDYAMRLFNGDLGVIFPAETEMPGEEGMRAYFRTGAKGIRAVPPQRIPRHLPVYAMTVHRSQGSEYERILLILPDRPSPVVTRELLYTAITRARFGVEIWGRPELFRKAVETRIERTSGLRCRLNNAAVAVS